MSKVGIISKIPSKGLDLITNAGFYDKTSKSFNRRKVGDALTAATIGSVVLKDGVGCVMYVYQSLTNDKIPEKRRKFVAALDLTNGVLMIATQILSALVMKKINEKFFYKIFSKTFDKTGQLFRKYAPCIRCREKAANEIPKTKQDLNKNYNNLKDMLFDGFKFVTELTAATIIAKRMIVPFIATPLASVVEKKMDKHSAKHENNGKQISAADKNNSNNNSKNLPMNGGTDNSEITNLIRRNEIESAKNSK